MKDAGGKPFDETAPIADAATALGDVQEGASVGFFRHMLVAGRYRIVRFIAGGGMGEVFEADDELLGVRVALKAIRPEFAEDEQAVERFKREIQLARKVTHPNVCRIYDIGVHEQEPERPGQRPRRVFVLSMELLAGETLAARLRRAGRLTPRQAWPIVEQMAAALEAAHAAGVIHRDFKSANVVLAAPAGGAGAPRAVVTDFGLARAREGRPEAATTLPGAFLGTPGYMAPEQVEKQGEITPATDVYALGVVMFELVTGTLPFVGKNPLVVAEKRLRELAPSPRLHARELDPRWERVILRCLEREPAKRYETPAAVARDLRPRRRRRVVVTSAAALALGIAAGVLGWQAVTGNRAGAPPAGGAAAAPVAARQAVAVLGFRDLSGRAETAWLGTALAEMLTTELAAGDALRVIPGDRVARARQDLALGGEGELSRQAVERLAQALAVEYVVTGSYVVVEDAGGARLRVDVRLEEARTGEIRAAVSEPGSQAELFDVVARAGARLRHALGAGETPAGAAQARSSLPADSEAARHYSEGLSLLRRSRPREAAERLQAAVEREPRFALAHSALAEAWSILGHDARAREAAGRARELAAPLPRAERLEVEARFHQINGEPAKAAEIYATLFDFYPDNLELGLRLLTAQTLAAQRDAAEATLRQLRALPAPARDDARLDLGEGLLAAASWDYPRARDAARRAAERARALGASLLEAEALNLLGRALKNLGDPDGAFAAASEAERLHRAGGDAAGAANALGVMRELRLDRGDLAGALELTEKRRAVYAELGHERGLLRCDLERAASLQELGDLPGARAAAEAAAGRAAGLDRRELGVARGFLGQLDLDEGRLHAAARAFAEARAIFTELDNKRMLALAASLEGELLRAAGDLAGARGRYEEALAIRTGLGLKTPVAASRLDLAFVALDEGDAEAAAREATEALAIFEAQGALDRRAACLGLLARAHLVAGRTADARDAAMRMKEAAAGAQDYWVATWSAATAALVDGAGGAAAARAIEALAADAARRGFRVFALELRLDAANAEGGAARARRAAVEKEALKLGLEGIARRAAL